MKKLFALTMAGVCALAFAAAADAGVTLRMKAPTVKTATRTESNIVDRGSVKVNFVYTDWSSCATNYMNAAGGYYDVTTLNLNNLLTSQQIYDDLRDKFTTTDFAYKRQINNGSGNYLYVKKTEDRNLLYLDTLVPAVADETVLTALISTGKAYSNDAYNKSINVHAGQNNYEFSNTSNDKDGTFYAKQFTSAGSITDMYNGVIPGRTAQLASGGTANAAADTNKALEAANKKTYSAEDAKNAVADLRNQFISQRQNEWYAQEDANYAVTEAYKNNTLKPIYDSFLNDQANALANEKTAIQSIADSLKNGSISYEEAKSMLQGLIASIEGFDKAAYDKLVQKYATALANLKAAYEKNYADNKARLASELETLIANDAQELAALEAKLADELQALKDADAKSLADLESKLAGELSDLKVADADTLAALEAKLAGELEGLKSDDAEALASLESKLAGELSDLKVADADTLAALEAKLAGELEGLKSDDAEALASLESKLAGELLGLKTADSEALASLESKLAGELAGLKTADAEALAALESNLSRELSVLKATNASAYAEASEKADADKAALESTRENTVAEAAADRDNAIQAAKDAVAAYEAASNRYSNSLEWAADERDGIKDNYDSKIYELEDARDEAFEALETERNDAFDAFKNAEAKYNALNSDYNSLISSTVDSRTNGLANAVNGHMVWSGNVGTVKLLTLKNVTYYPSGNIKTYEIEGVVVEPNEGSSYKVGDTCLYKWSCSDGENSWLNAISNSYYNDTYVRYTSILADNSSLSGVKSEVDAAYAEYTSVKSTYSNIAGTFSSKVSSVRNSYEAQIKALEEAKQAELNTLSEKYYGENGIATKAKADIEESIIACNGNPSTYVEVQTSEAESVYASKEAAAAEDYQNGIAAIDDSLVAVKTANDKAEADKLADNEAQIAAKQDANAKAEASKLADNEAQIAAKQDANAKAEADRLADNEAQIAAKQDANAKAETSKLADNEAQIAAKQDANAKAEAAKLADNEAQIAAKQDANAKAEASKLADNEAQIAAKQDANAKAEASKLADNNDKIAAKKAANAKAEASKLADNNDKIAAKKAANAKAEADKLAANIAALKAIDEKYAADKFALENTAEEALAAFVMGQFNKMQANQKAAKLAELKTNLVNYMSSLTDLNGGKYTLDNVDMTKEFYDMHYAVQDISVYVAKYQAADLKAEEDKGTFEVDTMESQEAELKDNQFLSALSVSSKTKVAMVDGVLQEVTTNTESLYETTIYVEINRKVISPIILDMKGDGVLQASDGQHLPGHSYINRNNIVTDFFGDGFDIAMEWVGPQDGLLVAPNADGSVDMGCLFGTAGGYESGYEKLSLYDKNNDKKVSGDELKGLSIWQDANTNGIAEKGEVKSVQELGITSIALTNSPDFISSFERNGKSYKMWDWWPNAVELVKVAAK